MAKKEEKNKTGVSRREVIKTGLLATGAERYIRLLPTATIEPQLLRDSCEKIAFACAAAAG